MPDLYWSVIELSELWHFTPQLKYPGLVLTPNQFSCLGGCGKVITVEKVVYEQLS